MTASSLPSSFSLAGHVLIAMPSMQDQRFQRSVIYLCAHSPEGAMGLTLSDHLNYMVFTDLVDSLEIDDQTFLLDPEQGSKPILNGGPLEQDRGFVLHSNDYHAGQSTLDVDDGVCLTATMDILKAIAEDKGPEHYLVALGYAGWEQGQLEEELYANSWLTLKVDPHFLFSTRTDEKYTLSLACLGIDEKHLSLSLGHA